MMKVLLAVVMIAAVGIGTAYVTENKIFSSNSAPEVKFFWTAPTTGPSVHHYVAQVLVNEVDTLFFDPVTDDFIMLPVDYGKKYRIRVAAVADGNIQGPMSIWSLPYAPEIGPPGFNN